MNAWHALIAVVEVAVTIIGVLSDGATLRVDNPVRIDNPTASAPEPLLSNVVGNAVVDLPLAVLDLRMNSDRQNTETLARR